MNRDTFNDALLAFLQASPTPYHAVAAMVAQLEQAGFAALSERQPWNLAESQGYYLIRDGALIAFRMPAGTGQQASSGWRLLGAHTDSPCLKVKPLPELSKHGYLQLGVEPYGGVLMNPWFDRDLSIAGRVSYLTARGELASSLIDLKRPVAVIPSLAIHLDREANNSRKVNPQTDLPPLLCRIAGKEKVDFRALVKDWLQAEDAAFDVDKVLDYDLSFYDTQAPALVGLDQEFIASARLDNLLSCFVGLQALLHANDGVGQMLVCNDHEEVGSLSASGAQGPMLSNLFERLYPDPQERHCQLAGSLLISADNAHGIHPNYSDRHDSNHGPELNAGPVIKLNANQRYATTSDTSALCRYLAELEGVPVQAFVVRSDMACGSTIGPLTAAELGIRTLDLGVPTFGMHSIRELAGSEDAHYLYRLFKRFLCYQES